VKDENWQRDGVGKECPVKFSTRSLQGLRRKGPKINFSGGFSSEIPCTGLVTSALLIFTKLGRNT